MRIIKNIEEPMANFGDLMIGDVFLERDENICIKIPTVYSDFSEEETESLLEGCMNDFAFRQHEVNAYDLEKNEFFWLDDTDKVRPLNAYMEVR